mmetsp:Transcript_64435/g.179211  ORF Transcript_64435/g.179211 Transcript_64435/m.179211 type:complete len:280 (-) Transcript_64435:1437-2276(-)
MRRADHSECFAFLLIELLCNAEVDELEVPLVVEHHILRLQIAVHDVPVCQLSEYNDQRACVELRLGPGEHRGNHADGPVQLSTRDELRQHVDAFLRLESFDKRHDERMVVFRKQVTLALDLLGHPATDLLHPLQRVPGFRRLVLHEPDHAGRTRPNDLDLLDVLEGDAGVMQSDAVHQLLLHVTVHDLREHRLFHGQHLSLQTRNLDGRAARLVEEQGPLAEVRVLSHGALHLAVYLDCHLADRDDVECRARLALPEHAVALLALLGDERLHELQGLLL